MLADGHGRAELLHRAVNMVSAPRSGDIDLQSFEHQGWTRFGSSILRVFWAARRKYRRSAEKKILCLMGDRFSAAKGGIRPGFLLGGTVRLPCAPVPAGLGHPGAPVLVFSPTGPGRARA